MHSEVISTNPCLSRCLVLRSEAYRMCGNDLAARRDLERAIRVDPGQPWPYIALGSMLLAKDATKEALVMLMSFVNMSERSSELLRIRDRAVLVLQYFTNAISTLSMAVKVRPTVENLCELAQALHVAGDAASAQVQGFPLRCLGHVVYISLSPSCLCASLSLSFSSLPPPPLFLSLCFLAAYGACIGQVIC